MFQKQKHDGKLFQFDIKADIAEKSREKLFWKQEERTHSFKIQQLEPESKMFCFLVPFRSNISEII